jgi:alpha-1,4-digalacturonate transport system permease protein
MSILKNLIPHRYRAAIGRWLYRPVELLMTSLDLVLLPLQRVAGIRRMAYFFVAPNLIIFGIFILFPMLLNFYYGFTTGQSILLENRDYVGTENLETLLSCDDYSDPNTCSEDLFWRGVRNTFLYVTVQVTSMVLLASITAITLNRKIVLRGFFRSVFFYPVLLSPVVVALIWKWFLRYDNGLLNAILDDLGYGRVGFLAESGWATFWVIVVSDWAQMGFYTLILLAGLQAIPASLYEAAEIDGANAWRRFWSVTLPLLMPTMTVVLVLAFIRAVQVFDQVFVLTRGGPGTATLFIVQYIYRQAFVESPTQYGMAAAASLLLALVLLVLTLAQLFFARRSEAT